MTTVVFVGAVLIIWGVWAFFKLAFRGKFTVTRSSPITLQNTDRIVCNISLEIHASERRLLATLIPFSPDDRPALKAEVEVMADAVLNRWAFNFDSAKAARQASSFDSLANALTKGIKSPDFTVGKAIVAGIEIAYQLKEVKPEPPPTDRDEAIAQLEGKKSVFTATAQWVKDNPELAADPAFEPVISPIRKRFLDPNGSRFEHLKRRF